MQQQKSTEKTSQFPDNVVSNKVLSVEAILYVVELD